MFAPEVAVEMDTDLPFEILHPPDKAVEAFKDSQLRDSVGRMEVSQEGEDKDIQAIYEYLKNPDQTMTSMPKSNPATYEGGGNFTPCDSYRVVGRRQVHPGD